MKISFSCGFVSGWVIVQAEKDVPIPHHLSTPLRNQLSGSQPFCIFFSFAPDECIQVRSQSVLFPHGFAIPNRLRNHLRLMSAAQGHSPYPIDAWADPISPRTNHCYTVYELHGYKPKNGDAFEKKCSLTALGSGLLPAGPAGLRSLPPLGHIIIPTHYLAVHCGNLLSKERCSREASTLDVMGQVSKIHAPPI